MPASLPACLPACHVPPPHTRTQVKLDLGCVRLARDPASTLMEPLAALTALSDLRMRVYSNGEPLTLHLSQLTALSNLQVWVGLRVGCSGCMPVFVFLCCLCVGGG